MPEGLPGWLDFFIPGSSDDSARVEAERARIREAVEAELARQRAARQPPPTDQPPPAPDYQPPPAPIPEPLPGDFYEPGPPEGTETPIGGETFPPPTRGGSRQADTENPYWPGRYSLGAVMTPRTTRFPLPSEAPPPRPVQGVPREVEGELLERTVRIWEDYGDIQVPRRMGRDIEGELARNPRPGRSSQRGPFGTRRQGEIVIVGRRPPRPPITIGGVEVKMTRRGEVITRTTRPPLPIPLPRPAPTRPPRFEIPRPPRMEVPRVPPLPSPTAFPPPVVRPAPTSPPVPAPAPSAPAPRTTGQSQRTRARALSGLPRILLSALFSRSTPRSRLTLPQFAAATGAPSSPLPMPTPLPLPLPLPLTSLNTITASFSPPSTPTRTRTRECHCDDRPKKPKKRRPCEARGQLVWASGPKKGKPAGSRCIRFGARR